MPEGSPSRSQSTRSELAVNQPTRGADRNQQSLTETADQPPAEFLFPSLDDGITLLDIEGGRGVPILQSLVLDHLLLSDGPAFWVDAHGHATTTSLARLTPSQRLLDRIHVARGFTAYQHYGALCNLPTAVNQFVQQATAADAVATQRERQSHEQETSPHTPSLIVVPALDAQYRGDDTLGEEHAQTLQTRALARLSTYARGYDVPVLVTRTTAGEFSAPIQTVADQHLECEQTRMGPRFVGDEFETLVYPVDGGAYYQTTFAYWRQLLTARADQVGLQPASPPTPGDSGGTTDIGTGVMADGTNTTLTTNPLLDAWASTGGR
ncbi:hypothetical protein [Halostella pelagica]|uniref:hypothetical protein n=1 Tax=Halostella pelagica TaxID=2583824 RepID=UPI0010809A7D|nr:hypothetical protein [Halostella pelagica]